MNWVPHIEVQKMKDVPHDELSTTYWDAEDGGSTSWWVEFHILKCRRWWKYLITNWIPHIGIQKMVEVPHDVLSSTYWDAEDGGTTSLWVEYHILKYRIWWKYLITNWVPHIKIQKMGEVPHYKLSTTHWDIEDGGSTSLWEVPHTEIQKMVAVPDDELSTTYWGTEDGGSTSLWV